MNTQEAKNGGGYISKEQISAIQILLQSVQVAQKRGAYELPEAEIISKAVKQFIMNKEDQEKVNTPTQENINKEFNQNILKEESNNDDEPRVI
jgi:predicted RNA-binding protein YlxR (DUF448 family)